ncbi:MAG: serine/threonine protein kinase, partial [Anaerolineales bacterium]|nr:serine/threonine protein kinase [Anaerolineales bacterium]
MSKLIGQTIGKYQILERIGRGGMAEVFKAYQPSLNRHVAIKIMHSHLADDPDFVTRFEREATSVGRLRHPNIVRVYDFDVKDKLYYMVMEHIDGATLKDDIQERKASQTNGSTGKSSYSFNEIAYIITALASGLDYAHAQGIIHRDLKPANVMFTAEGQLVITDFGLVRLLNTPSQTMTGMVTGTPAYMSPEQAVQDKKMDRQSDLYSLGVILYRMVTGRLPFSGTTPEILHAHVYEKPAPPSSIASVSPEMEAIILRAMAKK